MPLAFRANPIVAAALSNEPPPDDAARSLFAMRFPAAHERNGDEASLGVPAGNVLAAMIDSSSEVELAHSRLPTPESSARGIPNASRRRRRLPTTMARATTKRHRSRSRQSTDLGGAARWREHLRGRPAL